MTTSKTNTDNLKEKYLSMAPQPYDQTVDHHFTDEELQAIKKYGFWLNAIWRDQVPLTSDKLKHFYLAKNRLFEARTKLESLWYKYKNLELTA